MGAVHGEAASTNVCRHFLRGIFGLDGHSEDIRLQSLHRRGALGLSFGQQTEDEIELAKTLWRFLEQSSRDTGTRRILSLELLEQSIPFISDVSLHRGSVENRRSCGHEDPLKTRAVRSGRSHR